MPNKGKSDSDDVDLLVIQHLFFILSLAEAVTVFLSSLCYPFCLCACRYGEKKTEMVNFWLFIFGFLRERRIGNLTGACYTLAVFKGHLVSG